MHAWSGWNYQTSEDDAMTSPEALLLGARLDEDHAPVTNGWMSVCRRCGAYTQSPLGERHTPSDNRLDRAIVDEDAVAGSDRGEHLVHATADRRRFHDTALVVLDGGRTDSVAPANPQMIALREAKKRLRRGKFAQ